MDTSVRVFPGASYGDIVKCTGYEEKSYQQNVEYTQMLPHYIVLRSSIDRSHNDHLKKECSL